VRLAIHMCLSL